MAKKDIITGQFVRIAQPPARFSERIVAVLIDWVVIIAWLYIMETLTGAASILGMVGSGTAGLLLCLPAVVYQPLCEYFIGGQTVGKYLLHTRVVMVDGSSPNIGAFLLRWMILPIDIFFTGAVALFTMLITPNRQRLGDLAAGTMVVKLGSYEKLKVSLDDFLFVHDDYEPTYPQAAQLSRDDAALVARALADHSHSRQQRIRQLAARIQADYAIETTDKKHEHFLSVVLSDFRYYDLKAI